MTRRLLVVVGLTCGAMLFPLVAMAEPLDPYLERNAAAEFTGQQVVSCDTPDGSRTVAVELTQTGGTTSARSAGGEAATIQVTGGTFSVVTDGISIDTSAAVSTAFPKGRYSVSLVESVQELGREAQRVTVVDPEGVVRATMTFDLATGGLLRSRIRNADTTVYCTITMVEFSDIVPVAAPSKGESGSLRTLEVLEAPDEALFADSVAGFSRLETFRWEDDGALAYYSDGLFSFTLLATRRPVVLSDVSVNPVTIDGGDYERWFGAGQSIYVWDASTGGLAMYGDLPIDLQDAVLDGLPEPTRVGVLSRWWRNLFG